MHEKICIAINNKYFKNDFFYKIYLSFLYKCNNYDERQKLIKRKIFRPLVGFYDINYKITNYLNYVHHYFKVLNNLIRFVQICKYKYGKIYDFPFNLSLDPIETIPEKEIIQLYHYDRIYNFTISDLHDIIYNNIIHSKYMIYTPISPKNPFNNKRFYHYQLMNLLIRMKENNFKCKPIVYDYLTNNMSIQFIYYKYYIFIKEYGIKDFIYSSDNGVLYSFISEMIEHIQHIDNFKNIFIDEFEDHEGYIIRIVNLLKKPLFHYLLYTNFTDEALKQYHYSKFCDMIQQILYNNPNFWKKKIIVQRNINHNNFNNIIQNNENIIINNSNIILQDINQNNEDPSGESEQEDNENENENDTINSYSDLSDIDNWFD